MKTTRPVSIEPNRVTKRIRDGENSTLLVLVLSKRESTLRFIIPVDMFVAGSAPTSVHYHGTTKSR